MVEWLEKEWIGKCKGNVVKAAGVGTLSNHELEKSLICCNCVCMETLNFQERLISKDKQSWMYLYIKEFCIWYMLFYPLNNLRRKYLGKGIL